MKGVRRILLRLFPAGLSLRLKGWAAKSNFLASLYYVLVPRFAYEQRAVLSGVCLHYRERRQQGDKDATKYMLRRNTHRLEKGLIMRPRRNVFAEDYIGETVQLFESLTAAEGAPSEDTCLLRSWSTTVLQRYFDATGSTPVIDRARERFRQIVAGQQLTVGTSLPYKRDLAPLRITYDDMAQLAQRRRSCRWFLRKLVPHELIDRAIAVASQSPSACNRQPFEFRVFDEPELVQKIAAIPPGTRGIAQNFPCVVVLVGKLGAFPYEADRHLPYIDGALASMALLFALEVQGISSCCLEFPDSRTPEAKMAEAIGLHPDERPLMLIALGYPDPEGEVPFSQKKSLDALRSYNRTS